MLSKVLWFCLGGLVGVLIMAILIAGDDERKG